MSIITLQNFIDHHKPGELTQTPGRDLIESYRTLLPDCLLELWEKTGIGVYSNGLIQIINPGDYKRALYDWLMLDDEDPSRLPIAISSFGTIFYYRKLSDEGDEDIAYIDPHVSGTDVLAWSLESFFNDYLCNEENISSSLDPDLFEKALRKEGQLDKNQMYLFAPALRLGGQRDIKFIKRGDTLVHLDILLQLALDN